MALLKLALLFLVIAIVAAILGFTDVAGAATTIAQVLFYIFIGLFLILLVAGLVTYNKLRS